jgi:nitroreductase
MINTFEALKQRTSVNHIDATRPLTDEQIKELVGYATEAPSSFNIQHWRFIALREKASKEKLKALAYNQQKVADAAVTFIILGDTRGHEKLPEAFAPLIQGGGMDQKSFDGLFGMANNFYANNPQMARDEAIRSGAFAAMNLMTAAQAMGLVSAPMIGFDPVGVKKEFNIPEHYIPVMIIAVGYAAPGNWPKKPRFSVDQVLSFENGRDWKTK